MTSFRKKFTLLESVVAIAILSISLAVILQTITSARGRIAKAEEQWYRMHALMDGAEYILLHGSSVTTVPEEYFPYSRDFTVSAVWEEMDMDEIHTEYQNAAGQLELKACTIYLISNLDGNVVDQLTVERIEYDDALAEQ